MCPIGQLTVTESVAPAHLTIIDGLLTPDLGRPAQRRYGGNVRQSVAIGATAGTSRRPARRSTAPRSPLYGVRSHWSNC